MAGGGAVILEEFPDFQFDFSPLTGEAQIAGNGLIKEPQRLELPS